MEDMYVCEVVRQPAEFATPQAQVDLLVVHEIALVEAPHLLEDVPPDHQEGADHMVHELTLVGCRRMTAGEQSGRHPPQARHMADEQSRSGEGSADDAWSAVVVENADPADSDHAACGAGQELTDPAGDTRQQTG